MRHHGHVHVAHPTPVYRETSRKGARDLALALQLKKQRSGIAQCLCARAAQLRRSRLLLRTPHSMPRDAYRPLPCAGPRPLAQSSPRHPSTPPRPHGPLTDPSRTPSQETLFWWRSLVASLPKGYELWQQFVAPSNPDRTLKFLASYTKASGDNFVRSADTLSVGSAWPRLVYGDYSPEDFHKWPPSFTETGQAWVCCSAVPPPALPCGLCAARLAALARACSGSPHPSHTRSCACAGLAAAAAAKARKLAADSQGRRRPLQVGQRRLHNPDVGAIGNEIASPRPAEAGGGASIAQVSATPAAGQPWQPQKGQGALLGTESRIDSDTGDALAKMKADVDGLVRGTYLGSPELIRAVTPGAKLMLMLRSPAERTSSDYYQHCFAACRRIDKAKDAETKAKCDKSTPRLPNPSTAPSHPLLLALSPRFRPSAPLPPPPRLLRDHFCACPVGPDAFHEAMVEAVPYLRDCIQEHGAALCTVAQGRHLSDRYDAEYPEHPEEISGESPGGIAEYPRRFFPIQNGTLRWAVQWLQESIYGAAPRCF